jgi:hypothetical protein
MCQKNTVFDKSMSQITKGYEKAQIRIESDLSRMETVLNQINT